MKRAADKLIDIAAGRPGTKGKAKPKSKPTTKRATTAKAAKPNDDTTKRATRATKTPQTVPGPLTDTQKTVVQLIHNGQSISAAMAQIKMSRGSFYTWRRQNPRFQHATRNAREDYRGLVTDGLEDLQVATAQFLDACIRSDNLSVRDRLRACNTFLRHVQSGAFVPASFPGDDPNQGLIDDDLTGPDFSDSDLTDNDLTSDPLTDLGNCPVTETGPNLEPASPYGPINQTPTAENPAENPIETHRPDVQSATATSQGPTTEPTHSEHSPLAESIINSNTTQISEKTVQSVQSKTTETMTPHMNSEIRTPNVSDGFNPSPERERRVNAEKQVPPAPIPTAEGAPSTSHTNNASPRAEQSDRANSSPGPGSRTPDPGPRLRPRPRHHASPRRIHPAAGNLLPAPYPAQRATAPRSCPSPFQFRGDAVGCGLSGAILRLSAAMR